MTIPVWDYRREYEEDLNQRRNEELAAVLERANRAMRQIAEQEKYDLETNHGTITEMQIKWIRETDKRLNELLDWER